MNNTKTLAIVAVAAVTAMLIATSIVGTHDAFADKKKYGKSQALSQANSCGNEYLPMNVGCQNTGSQVQGNGNYKSLENQQAFS
ncbi:MAG: hypothetical protein WBX81_10890 [Nitrososphaeraceae archaeon]|jgi:hypothetical protein